MGSDSEEDYGDLDDENLPLAEANPDPLNVKRSRTPNHVLGPRDFRLKQQGAIVRLINRVLSYT